MSTSSKADGQRRKGAESNGSRSGRSRGGSGRPTRSQRQAIERHRTWRRRLLALAALIAVAAIVWVVVPTGNGDEESASPSAPGLVQIDRSPGDGPLKAGEAVPSFSAPDLEGGTTSWSRFRGSPTVLAIWAAWCPHCQKELPILDAAVDQHPGVRFATIVTSLGANPGPSPQQYMADRGLSFPVAVDDARGTLAGGLGIRGFPSVYFVDASGVVRRATEGEVDGAVLQDSIAEIAER